MISFKNFRKNPYFFAHYFSVQLVVMATAAYLLSGIRHESPVFSWMHLLLLPFAFAFGVIVPVALHNAVHHNIKPKVVNEIIGELCGFFVLFGMAPFRISHVLHHANPDDHELDPHPPKGKGFAWFVATTQLNSIRVIANQFFAIHGRTTKTYAIMGVQMPVYYAGLLARIFIWWQILGPELFIAFYIPSYITNLLVFAHINWATHQTLPSGEVVIVNLNHNLYYKTVNFIGSGCYFHLNHHLRPGLYNPATMKVAAPKPAPVLHLEASAS